MTADAFDLDLQTWDGTITPEMIAQARADERDAIVDKDAAERAADEANQTDNAVALPPAFDSWSDNQRETWGFDPYIPREEGAQRRSLYTAWLADRRPQDEPAETDSERRGPFANIAALLDGGLTTAAPDGGPARTDGARVMYRGKVNALIGDPESAKTLLALCVLADELNAGRVGAFIDTDHNGADFVLRFLLAVGVTRDALVDRFNYAEPDDREELLAVVDALAVLEPCAVVLDSVGENLSLWGVSANDDQGVIDMNRATAAKLAKAGHLVVTIDHLAKNSDSRRYGATGSTAKKRAVNGAMYEVVVVDEFSPDDGGKSALILRKDRTGGVRALGYQRGQTVAVFEVMAPDPKTRQQAWHLHPGTPATATATAAATKVAALAADVLALDQLTPPPTSKTDVMARKGWGTVRALAALNAWRAQAGGGQP